MKPNFGSLFDNINVLKSMTFKVFFEVWIQKIV